MQELTSENLSRILSLSPAIIYTCKAEGDFSATFVSENITSLFGYSPQECLKNPNFWRENIHPDDYDDVFDSYESFFEKGHHVHEYRFRKKDGSYTWVLDELRLIRDSDGNPLQIVGSWLDISTRKKAEQNLQASNILFRTFFDSNPIPTIITDPAGVVYKVNSAFTRTTGFTNDEVIGRTSQQMGFWRNQEDRERMVAAIMDHGFIDNLEAQFYGKNDRPMTCIVSSRRIEHDGEIRMLSTVIDVTERRKVEERQRKTDQLFRTLFNTNPIPTIISTADGIVDEVNESFLLSSGFTREEVVGKDSKDLFWADLADRKHMIDTVRERGFIDNYECMFYDKAKNPRTCLLSCRAIEKDGQLKILNTLIDISDQRKAEEERLKSEQLFRALFEISPVGSIVTSPDGLVHLVNPAFIKASGYAQEEIVGKTVYDLGFWNDQDMRLRMLTAIRNYGYIDNLEAVVVAKNNRKMTCLISSRAIDFDGETRILNIVVDITEQRLAEKAVKELEQAKSDFISTAAHELRTPLIAVIGYCELLDNAVDMGLTDQQQKEFLEVIQSNAEILNRLVDDLLDIGRIQIGRSLGITRTETELMPLIDKVVASSVLKSGRHEIVVEQGDNLPKTIWVDSGRIAQVLNNLLSNAIKYSPSGGIVKVRLECCPDHVNVSVVDPGIGMTAEQAEHIFDRFYRVDKDSSESLGLGLGLSIVKQIIIDHGGNIEVASYPGKGTTVKFSLPFRA